MITDILSECEKNEPHFHKTILSRYHQDIDGYFFLNDDTYNDSCTIDLSKVVGHSQGYGEMDWSHMLHNLKRIKKSLAELESNPDYYLSEEHYGWSFIQVDDKFYISQGKHRTTIARYFLHFNPELFPDGPLIKGAGLTIKNVDHDLTNTITRIRNLLLHPDFLHLGFHVLDDLRGTRRFSISNPYQNRSRWFFRADELEKLVDALNSSSGLRRFLGVGIQQYLRRYWWLGINHSDIYE